MISALFDTERGTHLFPFFKLNSPTVGAPPQLNSGSSTFKHEQCVCVYLRTLAVCVCEVTFLLKLVLCHAAWCGRCELLISRLCVCPHEGCLWTSGRLHHFCVRNRWSMANHISLASPDSSESTSYCKSVFLIKIKLS